MFQPTAHDHDRHQATTWMIEMLRRPGGATLPQLARPLGWPETRVETAIRGLGVAVVTGKPSPIHRVVYRVAA